MPKKSSTHRLSLHPPQILANSGTPSTSFYVANLFLNFHPASTLNLSPLCLPISFPTKYSNFIPLSSRILPILRLIFNYITFHPISVFTPVSREELYKLISQSSNTFGILIPFLHLFLNNVYLYSSPL